jgi:hypothetical protein
MVKWRFAVESKESLEASRVMVRHVVGFSDMVGTLSRVNAFFLLLKQRKF